MWYKISNLTRYPWTLEITYDQGSEFIGSKFIKPLIEKCHRTIFKPISSDNPNSNSILEIIQSVLGNLLNTYIDKDDLWLGILAAAVFANLIYIK